MYIGMQMHTIDIDIYIYIRRASSYYEDRIPPAISSRTINRGT